MITEEQFRKALGDVVEKYGADHRVFACRYRSGMIGREPICIVGAALYEIDPEFIPQEGACAGRVLALYNGAEDPRDSSKWPRWYLAASAAQIAQDMHQTWGEALAKYDRIMSPATV